MAGGVDLVTFERAAYGRAPDRVPLMIQLLNATATGTLKLDASRPDRTGERDQIVARLVAAIAAVVADPEFRLDAVQTDAAFPLSSTIARLFAATSFGTSDFLFSALSGRDGALSLETLARRLPFLSCDSGMPWPITLLDRLSPAMAQQFLCGLISSNPVTTPRGQQRREELLDHAHRLPDADFPRSPDHLVLLSSAWMTCSYASGPRKHDIKRLLNRTLRRMAAHWGFHDLPMPATRTIKPRPVMLFAAEIMHSGHVQYRYFGQYLRQLRDRFELVLLTASTEVDDAVTALFDRIVTFERGGPGYLNTIYRAFVDVAPDIVFYPSVGMRHWGPLFANLRLAPVQLTALGHSASTFCDTIDYYVLEEGYVSDPALFGETVITLPDDSLKFERAAKYVPVAPELRASPDRIRVVVPSNLLKLNPRFVSTLARVRKEARRPIEFHFFPNAAGLEIGALKRMTDALLPGAKLHSRMAYPRYLQLLSQGDLNLSPFPFGGLHSVIDSLRQGLPVVAMECPEPHGRTDAMLLRRLGMPDWLIARDEDEYVAAALRVIEDDETRLALGRQALALDIDTLMFGDATTPLGHEAGDAIEWLYRHHEAIQAAGRKSWSLADRAAFA